jgi:hypothetical protein
VNLCLLNNLRLNSALGANVLSIDTCAQGD